MKETLRYLAGFAGPSGFGSNSTAEQVTQDCSCLFPSQLTAIITGATSGIGAETARVLAKRGVRLIIPARDVKKATEVKERIQKESPQAEIFLFEMDLSSLASIKSFCSGFLSLGLPLNILINNAGKFSQKLEFSEDKVEMTFATNYLGHYFLTDMLLEKMIETADQTGIEGRIINVSSIVHSWVKRDAFHFSHLRNPINYNGTRAYAQTKLANILHAKEIARQFKEMNARVTINAVHPGIVKTGIIREHKGFITGMNLEHPLLFGSRSSPAAGLPREAYGVGRIRACTPTHGRVSKSLDAALGGQPLERIWTPPFPVFSMGLSFSTPMVKRESPRLKLSNLLD